MIKPGKILLFVLAVFLLLAVVILITPSEGVRIGSFTFNMPTFKEMFAPGKTETVDISDIIENGFDIDSVSVPVEDTLNLAPAEIKIRKASYDSLVQKIHLIQLNDDARKNLMWFFNKLKRDSTVRIMHYGDSQIEGDRITSYIRNKLQVKFGGTGPGLRPAVQPYDYVFSAVQTSSPNFKRYPIYGKVDSLITHKRYGVMGALSRFAPPVNDTVPLVDSLLYEGELTIGKSNISYRRTKIYKRMRLFYGNEKRPVNFSLIIKGDTVLNKILQANTDYGVISYNLPDSTDFVTLHFSGYDSPDIYGIDLSSPTGVVMDNIALRGSSGTIFTKSDFVHSVKMYNDLKPNLFILQFGGNVMPYIKSKKAVKRYGRLFRSQILRLKRECPDAAILVIGPSDMSTKQKDKYVTYELLPDVVETMRDVALSSGAGFWDMYEAMGGLNSMPSWVNAEPQLARPDYTHFSPRGARLVANMFYNALILEYNNYLKETK